MDSLVHAGALEIEVKMSVPPDGPEHALVFIDHQTTRPAAGVPSLNDQSPTDPGSVNLERS